MKLSCRRWRVAITRWADRELSVREEARLRDHLAACEACAAAATELAEMRRHWAFANEVDSRPGEIEAILAHARATGCESVATFDRALLKEPGFVAP